MAAVYRDGYMAFGRYDGASLRDSGVGNHIEHDLNRTGSIQLDMYLSVVPCSLNIPEWLLCRVFILATLIFLTEKLRVLGIIRQEGSGLVLSVGCALYTGLHCHGYVAVGLPSPARHGGVPQCVGHFLRHCLEGVGKYPLGIFQRLARHVCGDGIALSDYQASLYRSV